MTTFPPFGRHRLSEAQQPAQAKLLDVDGKSVATTARQTRRATLTQAHCPRCHRTCEPHSKNVCVCRDCYEELRQEAERQQEAGYLCAWLRSRVDKDGFPYEDSALVAAPSDQATALRLVRVARKLNIPWTEPVQQVAFATRMRGLLALYSGNAGDGGDDDDDGPDGGEAA